MIEKFATWCEYLKQQAATGCWCKYKRTNKSVLYKRWERTMQVRRFKIMFVIFRAQQYCKFLLISKWFWFSSLRPYRVWHDGQRQVFRRDSRVWLQATNRAKKQRLVDVIHFTKTIPTSSLTLLLSCARTFFTASIERCVAFDERHIFHMAWGTFPPD